jgi:hypothetical protein
MRPSVGLIGLCLLLAPAVLAQEDLPDLNTVSVPDGDITKSEEQPKETAPPKTTDNPENENEDSKTTADAQPTASVETFKVTGDAPPASSVPTEATASQNDAATTLEAFHLTGLPTIAGVGIPDMVVPDTAAAPYMQKSSLPDGTVFICVGAALGFFGAAILAWRGLVAWSLHRSVKRAALAQSMSDMKGAGLPGRKKGLYNVVGANSNMSLDHLSAAPPGKSKPFATMTNTGTPPKSTSTNSLFFSPTAGGARPDSMANRSSSYLPAGYYPTGNAQPAAGSHNMQVGGHGAHLSTHSLAQPGNRFSHRSGISPPASPSLPPSSRGYDRAPPSRDGMSIYNRNSVATLGANGGNRGMYGAEAGSMSQLSLNVPGGTTVPGGRAPSAYLEDLFENHGGAGNGPNARY